MRMASDHDICSWLQEFFSVLCLRWIIHILIFCSPMNIGNQVVAFFWCIRNQLIVRCRIIRGQNACCWLCRFRCKFILFSLWGCHKSDLDSIDNIISRLLCLIQILPASDMGDTCLIQQVDRVIHRICIIIICMVVRKRNDIRSHLL